MKSKEKKIVFHKEKIIGVLIVCAVFLLSIGFSESSMDIGIDSLAAAVRIQKDIRVTGISMTSTSNDALSNWEAYNFDNVTAGVSLPNADSTITYEIEITNIGNIESMIDSITGLDSHLEIKNINGYTLKSEVCDDDDITMCKLGAVKHFTIKIGYKSGEYNSNSTDFSIMMNMNFAYLSDKVAKTGDSYYDTLQDAIDSVDPDDPDETLVILLKNTREAIEIKGTRKIYLDLKDKTITNNGNASVIKNYGILYIKNGNIVSNASSNGAVNNEGKNNSTANITIDGTRIIMTGGRQALWNNMGTAKIKGNSYLYSEASARPALHNISPGTMTIEGGTFISSAFYAIQNTGGTVTIGIKDGNIDNSKILIMNTVLNSNYPAIQTSGDIKFYDGIIKSQNNTVSAISRLKTENEGKIINTTEVITDENQNSDTYKVSYIALGATLNVDPNTGICGPYDDQKTALYEHNGYIAGDTIGTLPNCSKSGYILLGFYDAATGGNAVNENTVLNSDLTIYPQWQKTSEVAQIGATKYDTLQEAVSAARANTLTEITLLKDIQERVEITSAKVIAFHFNNHTLTNAANNAIFDNKGNITITDGNFQSDANQAIINSYTGATTNISGGTFTATGNRQAVYIRGGTVNISGNTYMVSETDGVPSDGAGSTMDRGTVQNLSAGTLIITGGTIVGDKQIAVSNEGTLVIGVDDGTIDTNSLLLVGHTYGVKSSVPFDFYDGGIKGKQGDYIGTVIDHNDNTTVVHSTEIFDGVSYYTAFKEVTQ